MGDVDGRRRSGGNPAIGSAEDACLGFLVLKVIQWLLCDAACAGQPSRNVLVS